MGAAEPIDIDPIETSRQTSQRAASGSSFYAAMRILPRAQREGMFEIYAFCRHVDDIADGNDSPADRLAGLTRWRADIEALYAGRVPAHLRALARVARTYALDKADFLAVIDGMEMDARATIVAPDLSTLDLYCDRVASAVGRLSVKIFGLPDEDGRTLSHHLGRALQLTNILRDIDEDAAIGRVYLPAEMLARAGIASPQPAAIPTATLDPACAPLAAQAREHFRMARAIMARYPRRMVIAPRVMAQAYGVILDKLVARGFTPPRQRVRLSRLWRLWLGALVVRQMLFR